jgi:hypothetical protein
VGQVRALGVRAERHLLEWRTRFGRRIAVRHLDALAAALDPEEWQVVKFYEPEEFPTRVPMLWMHTSADKNIGTVVNALATSGGTWGYHEALRGRPGYLCPCGDGRAAAEHVVRLVRHRLFPAAY